MGNFRLQFAYELFVFDPVSSIDLGILSSILRIQHGRLSTISNATFESSTARLSCEAKTGLKPQFNRLLAQVAMVECLLVEIDQSLDVRQVD